MTWLFNGAAGFDQQYGQAPGLTPSDGGPITVLTLLKPTAATIGVLHGLAGGTGVWSVHSDTSKWFTEHDFSAGYAQYTTSDFMAVGYSKDDSSATVNWHSNIASGGVYGGWLHGTGTVEPDTSTVTSVEVGRAPGGRLSAYLAAAAVWTVKLPNADVEAVGVTSGNDWMAASPAAYWQCNTDPAAGLPDLTGNGADTLTLPGSLPTLREDVEPPGWTYYSEASSVDLAMAANLGALAGAATLGRRVHLAGASGLGALSGSATLRRTVHLAGAAGLGALVAHALLDTPSHARDLDITGRIDGPHWRGRLPAGRWAARIEGR